MEKSSNPKDTLYVGGLAEKVNEAILHSAFIPFGEIKEVSIPLDGQSNNHRGFGFVQFEEKGDAAAAIDNMHNAELHGKVLKVNYAIPMKIKGGDKGWSHQPVWADLDKYLEEQQAEKELEELDAAVGEQQQQQQEQDQNQSQNQEIQADQERVKDAMEILEEANQQFQQQ
eukprot:TRINITY_DN21895_c0_g1_i1.p1 TRINITY_DN21895_c0_g1~~TRINITY_DN21895_c0_g1_i1.p1  ORF type:complete len:171 (-),score=44.21 TRINITY_DN21895_c0_g1_i1:399-911(-)